MNIFVVDIISMDDEEFQAFRNKDEALTYLKSQIGNRYLDLLSDGKKDSSVLDFFKDDMKSFDEYEDENLTEYVIGDSHYKLMTVPIN